MSLSIKTNPATGMLDIKGEFPPECLAVINFGTIPSTQERQLLVIPAPKNHPHFNKAHKQPFFVRWRDIVSDEHRMVLDEYMTGELRKDQNADITVFLKAAETQDSVISSVLETIVLGAHQ